MARPQDEVLEQWVQMTRPSACFGCLWRVRCDSHNTPALDASSSTRPPKTADHSSSIVHIVVALRHHVGVGWAGTHARMLVVTRANLEEREAEIGNLPRTQTEKDNVLAKW